MRVPMIAIAWMRVSNVQAGGALRHSEQVGQDAGDNRGQYSGDGTKHRHQRIGKRVGQADAVDPGLRCRDEEGHRRSRRSPFSAQADRRRQHAAGAQWQRRAKHRSPQHRLELAGTNEPSQQPARYEHCEHAGHQKADKQIDRSLLHDRPEGLQHGEKEIDHSRTLEAGPGAAFNLGPQLFRWPPLGGVTPPCTYFGKYFLFKAQATENCGSTTLAI
jgi:hypothetical protein